MSQFKRPLLTVALAGSALSGLMLMAACSSGGGSQMPPNWKAQAKQASPTATPLNSSNGGSIAPGHELSPDSGTSSRFSNNSPTGGSGGKGSANNNSSNSSNNNSNNSSNSKNQNSNSGSGDEIPLDLDPSNLTPDQIFADSDRQGRPVMDGRAPWTGNDGSPLFYSGSGQDGLLSQLKAIVASEPDSSQRDRNHAFAAGLRVQSFHLDPQTHQMTLSIQEGVAANSNKSAGNGSNNGSKNNSNNSSNNSTNNGTANNSGSTEPGVIALSGVAGDNGIFDLKDVSGQSTASAQAMCMDEGGGCNTLQIKVTDNGSNGMSVAQIIARDTRSMIYVHGHLEQQNPTFDSFALLLDNTFHDKSNPRRILNLRMLTTEIVGGRSTFTIDMFLGTGENTKQTLSFTGALIRPADTDYIQKSIRVVPSRAFNNGVLDPSASKISSILSDARLERNDGRGNLQIQLTVAAPDANSQPGVLLLTFGRIHVLTNDPVLK